MPGRIEAIWIKRAHRGVMDSVQHASLVAGQGIAGSVDDVAPEIITILEGGRAAFEARRKRYARPMPVRDT